MFKKKYRILIVDDIADNIWFLAEILDNDYIIMVATDGQTAYNIATVEPQPDIILLDVQMPDMDGYAVCKLLKCNPLTHEIPILFVTALDDVENEAKGFSLGGADYIRKPFHPEIVKARIRTQIENKLHSEELDMLVKERTKELVQTQLATIKTLALLPEWREPSTGAHIKRTQMYVQCLVGELAKKEKYKKILTPTFCEALCISAPLHDLGKISIPDTVLLKSARLSASEFEVIKQHTTFGAEFLDVGIDNLGDDCFLCVAKEIAEFHHEWWNGTGYPYGLQSEEIPISARIMALADVYDALITYRIYKPALPHEQVYEMILEESGTHFDPEIVEIFQEIHLEFKAIAEDNASEQDRASRSSKKLESYIENVKSQIPKEQLTSIR